MTDGGWRSMFRTGPARRGRLKAALLTTYDRPDERFLVEHLFPDLLNLDRTVAADAQEKRSFLGELANRLEALTGKTMVVSSMPVPQQTQPRAYPWLWRMVQSMHVGCKSAAIQHAKLWMFHWGGTEDCPDELEIVISSANLTLDAMSGQIQAAWCKTIPLVETGSDARRRSWGVVPRFLELLGEACAGESQVAYFVELLRRSQAPADVSFIASVPGTHTRAALRRDAWGSAALESVVPAGKGRTHVQLTVPYVGTWDRAGLAAWCSSVGAEPKDLTLLWLDKHHPWARQGDEPNWLLPKQTLRTLIESGATLLKLEAETIWHSDHRAPHDTRWSHAKLYHLRRGRSERLLITSANFSSAAWGAAASDGLTIKNFELGVCLDKQAWPIDETARFADPTAAFTISAEAMPAERAIAWADASWDGSEVTLRCRTRDAQRPDVEILSAQDQVCCKAADWATEETGCLMTRMAWTDVKRPPTMAYLSLGNERCEIGIRDLRPVAELRDSPLPETTDEESQTLRDRLLLEEYGHYSRTGDDVAPPPVGLNNPLI